MYLRTEIKGIKKIVDYLVEDMNNQSFIVKFNNYDLFSLMLTNRSYIHYLGSFRLILNNRQFKTLQENKDYTYTTDY